MSQQINLINPSLIRQKDFLTATNIGLTYGLLVLVMVAWFFYTQSHIDGLKTERDAVVAELQQVQTHLAQETAARVPRPIDKGLQQELAKLENKQQMQLQILHTITQGANVADKGLAAYLRGFAKQTIDGLWLIGFSLDKNLNAMTLRGRSLQADLLPRYIAQLSAETVFAGHEFGGLRMKRPALVKTAATGNTANNQSNISTNTTLSVVPTLPVATTEAADAPTLAPYVEFELQALVLNKEESTIKPTSQSPIGVAAP